MSNGPEGIPVLETAADVDVQDLHVNARLLGLRFSDQDDVTFAGPDEELGESAGAREFQYARLDQQMLSHARSARSGEGSHTFPHRDDLYGVFFGGYGANVDGAGLERLVYWREQQTMDPITKFDVDVLMMHTSWHLAEAAIAQFGSAHEHLDELVVGASDILHQVSGEKIAEFEQLLTQITDQNEVHITPTQRWQWAQADQAVRLFSQTMLRAIDRLNGEVGKGRKEVLTDQQQAQFVAGQLDFRFSELSRLTNMIGRAMDKVPVPDESEIQPWNGRNDEQPQVEIVHADDTVESEEPSGRQGRPSHLRLITGAMALAHALMNERDTDSEFDFGPEGSLARRALPAALEIAVSAQEVVVLTNQRFNRGRAAMSRLVGKAVEDVSTELDERSQEHTPETEFERAKEVIDATITVGKKEQWVQKMHQAYQQLPFVRTIHSAKQRLARKGDR